MTRCSLLYLIHSVLILIYLTFTDATFWSYHKSKTLLSRSFRAKRFCSWRSEYIQLSRENIWDKSVSLSVFVYSQNYWKKVKSAHTFQTRNLAKFLVWNVYELAIWAHKKYHHNFAALFGFLFIEGNNFKFSSHYDSWDTSH